MNRLSPSQPSLKGSRVPPGHIFVNCRLQRTELIRLFNTTGVKPILQDGLGIVDFYPSSTLAVIWLPEDSLISKMESLKHNIIKLSSGGCNGMVIVQVTGLSRQYYKELQFFTATESSHTSVIPVATSMDLVKILSQLVYNQGTTNPIVKHKNCIDIDNAVFSTLKSLPAVGDKKARQLLEKYSSLQEIEAAKLEDLETVVGKPAAINISSFIHKNVMKMTPKR